MERFSGFETYMIAAVPVLLLLTAVFYMGYRKSCKLAALILTQFFAFLSVMISLTLLGIYELIPAVVMPFIYIVVVLIFYVGGATLTGVLVEARVLEQQGQDMRGKEEK